MGIFLNRLVISPESGWGGKRPVKPNPAESGTGQGFCKTAPCISAYGM
jgi:hypothetical protein